MTDALIRYDQISGIFERLALGVIVLSEHRKIMAMNAVAEKLTGAREADVLGRFCYDIFLDYLCGGRCKYLDSPDAERETVVSQIRITDQDNRLCSITKIECPLYGADGRIVGCVEVFQDKTVLHELMQRIRFEGLKLKHILDSLDHAVFTVDLNGHIAFFNRMAETITGYSRTELLGRNCGTVFGKSFCEDLRGGAIATEGDRECLKTEIVDKSGNHIPIRAKYFPIRNEDGTVVGGMTTLSDLSLQYQLDRVVKEQYTFCDMVSKHPDMQRIFEAAPVIAASDATVLIEGPTGTGKDLLAKIIHNASTRSHHKMVKVNCASIPGNLLESEMFGYVRGAFTGADRDKPGRFQMAHRGTLFLDEIGDLPLPLQAKLLRVIEDKEFYPLGSRQTTQVDVRIISATNQNLMDMVEAKTFREDLFYRLNLMRLYLPPLRERRCDIPLLVGHILKRLNVARGTRPCRISAEVMEILLNHDYPGNVREMENIIEHAMILCQSEVIEKRHLPPTLLGNKTRKVPHHICAPVPEEESREERERILDALNRMRWNKGQAAQALNMDRSTLWRKMKRYGIDVS
ncbi:MAG: sigma 54-interacting transcriptional regulator [Desulfobacterales bacterium]